MTRELFISVSDMDKVILDFSTKDCSAYYLDNFLTRGLVKATHDHCRNRQRIDNLYLQN